MVDSSMRVCVCVLAFDGIMFLGQLLSSHCKSQACLQGNLKSVYPALSIVKGIERVVSSQLENAGTSHTMYIIHQLVIACT